MISRKATSIMFAAAALLAAMLLILSALRLFHNVFGWMEFSIIGAIVVLVLIAGFSRARHRADEITGVRSARASVLKDLWEKRHRREW